MRRHDLLRGLHELLTPRSYLEIGVSRGASMALSRTKSIGVDPAFRIDHELHCDIQLWRRTSDEFFADENALAHLESPVVDLAFIDGMHLAEYAFRDFVNVERHTHPTSVIVVDDVLPRTIEEADRDQGRPRSGPSWAGDVYKILAPLRALRPDLVCLEVNTRPTGTVVVLLPDATSTTLLTAYDDLVEAFVTPDPQSVPEEILNRQRALDPARLLAASFWSELGRLRELTAEQARPQVAALLNL